MDKEIIWEQIEPIVNAHIWPLPTDNLKITDRLDDLGIDSLELVLISTDIEKKFGIKFEESNMWEMSTCEDIVDTIYNEINAEKK